MSFLKGLLDNYLNGHHGRNYKVSHNKHGKSHQR
ncbi:Uncharacterised protein [Legionella beliardensis]|uniref:Uncharacterized protein n=1 Tax=Legionella beliardensis TaxID=91822 RepID=A0A378JT14_9GAMM|nr:Uncharacterised protein [Legionella beliardensis]